MLWVKRYNSIRPALKACRDRCRRGLAALEMALIAPAFFLIFIGIVEISLLMLTLHLIENSTYNASRLAKTGFVDEGKTQMETVMDLLMREMGSLAPLVNLSNVQFTSTSYGSIRQIDEPGEGQLGLGGRSDIVVITVTYPWQVFTPLMNDLIGDDNGIINLSSRIVVRNEPD